MRTIHVTDYGVIPSQDTRCSDALTQLITSCSEACELVFPTGLCFLKKG